MVEEGEVETYLGLWHLRGDPGHPRGTGNHMGARKDMPTGNQESGSGDAPAFGKDANDGRFELPCHRDPSTLAAGWSGALGGPLQVRVIR
jgi:hypothetical protein